MIRTVWHVRNLLLRAVCALVFMLVVAGLPAVVMSRVFSEFVSIYLGSLLGVLVGLIYVIVEDASGISDRWSMYHFEDRAGRHL